VIEELARRGASRLGPELELRRIREDPTHPMYAAYYDRMHKDHDKVMAHFAHLLRRSRETTPGV
jgi:hypothetical protein